MFISSCFDYDNSQVTNVVKIFSYTRSQTITGQTAALLCICKLKVILSDINKIRDFDDVK